jgi:hypothetical protein
MAAFKMLGPTNMSSKQVGLANWGVVELGLLCANMELSVKLEEGKSPHW